jgi:hypothetical protein
MPLRWDSIPMAWSNFVRQRWSLMGFALVHGRDEARSSSFVSRIMSNPMKVRMADAVR